MMTADGEFEPTNIIKNCECCGTEVVMGLDEPSRTAICAKCLDVFNKATAKRKIRDPWKDGTSCAIRHEIMDVVSGNKSTGKAIENILALVYRVKENGEGTWR